jgi:protein-S-isoprenylcysteine O-methyltransferase
MNLPEILGLVYLASETVLRFSRRSSKGSEEADRGSLSVLWAAIGTGIALGIVLMQLARFAHFSLSPLARQIVVVVFVASLALRWWAILSLGKFFTVNVAIATDHQLIIRGPYRWMRHPSYTGLLLAFAALAVTFQNWLSIVGMLGPISLGLVYRIRIEEAALTKAFGDDYRAYAKTTQRLIPGIL